MAKCFRDGREISKPEYIVECSGNFISCLYSPQSNGLDSNGKAKAGFLIEVRVKFPGKKQTGCTLHIEMGQDSYAMQLYKIILQTAKNGSFRRDLGCGKAKTHKRGCANQLPSALHHQVRSHEIHVEHGQLGVPIA